MAVSFDENAPVLEITDLNLSYWTRAGEIPAVIDFSLTVQKGESIGLVGESGCGKSTVAMAIMQYMGNNGTIKSGSIRFKGVELTELPPDELRKLRGSHISMIYQEPFAALNPSLTLGTQLKEVPTTHENISDSEAWERAVQVLTDVRLPDPERVMAAYPHQISGGQQQRVVIAMALLSNPSLLLLDEPTTALDVTVEAGITKLITDISRKYGTSQIYISHNLGLILEVCDRVFVMYSGEVSRKARSTPCSRGRSIPTPHGLFGCNPRCPPRTRTRRRSGPIAGQLPLPHERPRGCNFGPPLRFLPERALRREGRGDGVGGGRRDGRPPGALPAMEGDRPRKGGRARRGEGPDGDRRRGPRGGRHAEVLRGPRPIDQGDPWPAPAPCT